MQFLKISFENLKPGEPEILIALLSNLPFEGFEEKDNGLLAFIREDYFNRDETMEVVKELGKSFSVLTIPLENWNKQWESNYAPVKIYKPGSGDPFVHIHASFHEHLAEYPYNILINPKMSFGTGHHATTHLMIEEMGEIDLAGKTVIDFGTGTGVLAILAEKLGAAEVIAVDIDTWSIENAGENASLNNCTRIKFLQSDRFPESIEWDILFANINLNVIMDNFLSIINSTNLGNELIFSGIIEKDIFSLRQRAEENGLEIINCAEKDGWVAIHSKSKS